MHHRSVPVDAEHHPSNDGYNFARDSFPPREYPAGVVVTNQEVSIYEDMRRGAITAIKSTRDTTTTTSGASLDAECHPGSTIQSDDNNPDPRLRVNGPKKRSLPIYGKPQSISELE
jgi:hypothetical protein